MNYGDGGKVQEQRKTAGGAQNGRCRRCALTKGECECPERRESDPATDAVFAAINRNREQFSVERVAAALNAVRARDYQSGDFQAFMAWAEDHLGQGYSVEPEDGSFIDPVTRWAFNGFKAALALARSECQCPQKREERKNDE